MRIALVRVAALIGAVAALGGCAGVGLRDAIVELDAFQPLAGMPQIRYATGAQHYAQRVAAVLPAAVARVESAHYRPFRAAPIVYVCGDDACFHRFVAPSYNFSAAVVYDNRLVLSARLFDREPTRLEPILRHELSHLHLGQRRGHYSMEIPVWFHEGLASLAADGGGADLATDADVWTAADSDRYFLPEEQHRPWSRMRAPAWGLSINLFYRQALLYLTGLRTQDEDAFRRWLGLIQDGVAFDHAFIQTYQTNPARSALAFFRRLHCAGAGTGTVECAAAMARD